MSIPSVKRAIISLAAQKFTSAAHPPLTHLDVGAGRGGLIAELRKHFSFNSQACDFHTERFEPDVPITQVNFDQSPLPYPDNSFDFVTSAEVVEHLENYHHLIREVYRVLKPNGLFIVTTPNVLNMKSRVRILLTGFPALFDPLPIKGSELYSSGHHITPIPYFYLAHALADADFINLRYVGDKAQKTSLLWLALLWPFLGIGWALFWLIKTRKGTITKGNRQITLDCASWKTLTSRTVIVAAEKSSSGQGDA